MSLADDLAGYVADADDASGAGLITAAGTVVTSPSAVSTDPLTVVLDGSSVAVPVKQFRAFPVFPSMRVGLVRIGTDWVVIGSFTNPGMGTGQQRMAVGADTPPELQAYGIGVAMLMYDTDAASGLEVGYFFIGISNVLDFPATQKVMLFGSVKYPVPGDPTSPTQVNVRTAHQINMDGGTWFKDHPVRVVSSVGSWRFQQADTFMEGTNTWFTGQQTSLNSTEVWVHGRLFQNNVHTIEVDGMPSTTTVTGTTNTLLPGTAITDITKELSGTRMRAEIHMSGFRASGAPYTRVHYGVRITDNNAGGALVGNYDVGRYGCSLDTTRYGFSGFKTLAAIPAGSYTVQAYMRTNGATQSFTSGAGEDYCYLKWEEIS